MKLRWFQVYDKNGVNSECVLQFWNVSSKCWESIPFVRVSYKDEEESLKDKNAVY